MNFPLTVKVGADLDGLQKELNKATGQIRGFSKGMAKVGGLIAGAFAVDKIIGFGKEVFNVTAQFQKFEAVLTNTLGHNGAAKAALAQITEFASKTPYAVNELTDSFIKLSNQGFIPTLEQMRSLGDLASAMGKSFDQLAEAIIDAQTGEFERLKEFGIRASKQGDQVVFTFKGVKTQVEFASDAIREYILSLGQVEGVTGGMKAQSETLGGGLSNLADSWEQLQLAIGRASEKGGIFSGILDLIAIGVDKLQKLIDTPTIQEYADITEKLIILRNQAAHAGDLETWAKFNDLIHQGKDKMREWWEANQKLAELQRQQAAATNNQAQAVALLNKQLAAGSTTTPVSGTKQGTNLKGAGFQFDLGMLDQFAGAAQAALAKVDGAMIKNRSELEVWIEQWKIRVAEYQASLVDFTGVVQGAFSGIGHAIGSAISGAGKFGDALLGVLGGVLVQLGEMLIAAGLGVESFKAALKSLNGVAAISAGIALIAIGSAVAGSIQSLGSSAGSSHSSAVNTGSRSSGGNIGTQGIEILVGGETVIRGDQLVTIINRQAKKDGRSKG